MSAFFPLKFFLSCLLSDVPEESRKLLASVVMDLGNNTQVRGEMAGMPTLIDGIIGLVPGSHVEIEERKKEQP